MFRRIASLLLSGLMLALLVHSPASLAAKELRWVGCGISKLGFMQDLARAYEKKTGIKITLEGGGATKGLREVAAGRSDLGGSCRLPLVYKHNGGADVVEPAERNIKLIPVGWDALVVIVSKDNHAADSITREQLRGLLKGEIVNWRQLGADFDKPINLYVRKGKISGVGLTLRQQLFDNMDEEFASSATVLASSGKIEEAVEKDPYGIAVSGISSSRHRNVKILKFHDVEPTMQNLKDGKYTLYRILFLVAPADFQKNPDLKAFVDFALSLEGQEVIKKAGTLPYHEGIWLLRKASFDYIRSMEVVDRSGMYTLDGH